LRCVNLHRRSLRQASTRHDAYQPAGVGQTSSSGTHPHHPA
jgi:hypothetical protein